MARKTKVRQVQMPFCRHCLLQCGGTCVWSGHKNFQIIATVMVDPLPPGTGSGVRIAGAVAKIIREGAKYVLVCESTDARFESNDYSDARIDARRLYPTCRFVAHEVAGAPFIAVNAQPMAAKSVQSLVSAQSLVQQMKAVPSAAEWNRMVVRAGTPRSKKKGKK